jgi:hypothetical protein
MQIDISKSSNHILHITTKLFDIFGFKGTSFDFGLISRNCILVQFGFDTSVFWFILSQSKIIMKCFDLEKSDPKTKPV